MKIDYDFLFPAPREVDWWLYDYLLDHTDNPANAFLVSQDG